jgi:ribosomal-protein-alanine N-acetyltransferase
MLGDGERIAAAPRIRICQRGDLTAVQEILELSPEAARWSESSLEEALSNSPAQFVVALWEQQVVGFLIGRVIADNAEILNLAVQPQYRRHGIASALVQRFLEDCRGVGAWQVFLEVRESNSCAIAFYQRLGFRQTGRRPGYYSSPLEAALILSFNIPVNT